MTVVNRSKAARSGTERPSTGSPILTRSNVVAFSAVNGAINTSFAPSVNGAVRAVEPGPTASTVYIGGSFQGVNGVTTRVALLNLNNGQVVSSFSAPPMNGVVQDLQLVGDRLIVGGYFNSVGGREHRGLVSLDANTGARQDFLQVQLTENHNYTGRPGQARAPVGAKNIAVTPQGDQMAVIPSFAGNGIAMALWSGRHAADNFLTAGADSARWHALAARRFGPRVRAAAWTARVVSSVPVQSGARGRRHPAPQDPHPRRRRLSRAGRPPRPPLRVGCRPLGR